MPEPITKSRILLVEGKDEVILFSELLVNQNLNSSVQVIEIKGKDQFGGRLRALRAFSGFDQVISIGVVRDADSNPTSAFQSVCSGLRNAKLPVPTTPMQSIAGPPQVTVMIVPNADTQGMIENVCLNSVSDDPAMACVEQYFHCLEAQLRALAENDIPKARVRAFLASREWLEIAHFEYLQRCMENYEPAIPVSSAIAVPKVHAFLASRYTPDLNLGIAAQRSDREDRYWRFDHPAFDDIKRFLQIL